MGTRSFDQMYPQFEAEFERFCIITESESDETAYREIAKHNPRASLAISSYFMAMRSRKMAIFNV